MQQMKETHLWFRFIWLKSLHNWDDLDWNTPLLYCKLYFLASSLTTQERYLYLFIWLKSFAGDTILRHPLERPLTSGAKVTLKTTRNEVASDATSLRTSFKNFSFILILIAVVVIVVGACWWS